MIIKGNRHGNGAKLAAYLLDGGRHGERVAEPELYGFAAENIHDAFRDAHSAAGVRAIENPLFHVQIRLPQGEEMTREQWDRTTARVLKTAGLEGQPYARVFHTDEKTGEIHCHLGVSLIDEETHHAKPLPFYKLRFKALARRLEEEFGLTRVKNHRDGPIKYGATKNEEQQAQRLGFDKDAVRNAIRQCWDASDCGRSFDDALAEAGLILAQGNRRDYVVIDPKGGLHVLGKRILDVPASQVREKLADLERENMPTVEQARELMLDLPRDRLDRLTRELAEVQRQIEAEQEYARRDPVRDEIKWLDAVANAAVEKEKIERQFVEPRPAPAGKAHEEETRAAGWQAGVSYGESLVLGAKTAAELDMAKDDLGGAVLFSDRFAEAFEQKGLAFALISPEESQRSHRENAFANEVGRRAARFEAGEIVLVTEARLERLRAGEWTAPARVHKLDQAQAENYLEMLALDRSKLKGIEETKAMLDAGAEERAEYWRELRLERAARIRDREPVERGKQMDIGPMLEAPARAAANVFNIGTGLAGLLFSIGTPKSPQAQARENHETAKATARRDAETEFQIDVAQYAGAQAQDQSNREQQAQAARDRQREHDEQQERGRDR